MIYYNETGELLPAEEIDLEKGYLVDRETVHHEAETHTASKTIPGGALCKPVVNGDGSLNVAESMAVLEQMSYVKFLETGNGTVKAYCPYVKPTRNIQMRLPGTVEKG